MKAELAPVSPLPESVQAQHVPPFEVFQDIKRKKNKNLCEVEVLHFETLTKKKNAKLQEVQVVLQKSCSPASF